MIQHHPDMSTLISYAAGALSSNFTQLVKCHVENCSDCQAKIQEGEQLGGQLLNMHPSSSEATQTSSFDDFWKTNINERVFSEANIVAPTSYEDMIESLKDGQKWKSLVPGIGQIKLMDGAQGTLRLFKIAPGMAIPLHTHNGNEMTLILKGSYSDELGRFKAGDVADVDDDTDHQPIADTGEHCICLIATEAPLKFKGLLPRLMQPFIGL
ncbi:ChrR family anti-sigma-E factor [Marinicellulosiphila megalodicopiae]|uniref:ChrR family anti-sigma-E factor n=1 Tax=Marinicellulosiphila megalodicopiae TaxID=2724896 RepID=UPI003BB0F208